jgi:hypothetical protein
MAVEPASMFCGAGSFRLFENDTHSSAARAVLAGKSQVLLRRDAGGIDSHFRRGVLPQELLADCVQRERLLSRRNASRNEHRRHHYGRGDQRAQIMGGHAMAFNEGNRAPDPGEIRGAPLMPEGSAQKTAVVEQPVKRAAHARHISATAEDL